MSAKINERGFVHLTAAIAVVIVVIATIGIWVFIQHSAYVKSAQKSQQHTASTSAQAPITGKPKTQPAATAQTSPGTGSSSDTSKTASPSVSPSGGTSTTPSSTPAQLPSVPTAVAPVTKTISISSDGCSITATANAGLGLSVDVYASGHGGHAEYTFPVSNSLRVHSGGILGMTVLAQITDNGTPVASAAGTITQSACPAADQY